MTSNVIQTSGFLKLPDELLVMIAKLVLSETVPDAFIPDVEVNARKDENRHRRICSDVVFVNRHFYKTLRYMAWEYAVLRLGYGKQSRPKSSPAKLLIDEDLGKRITNLSVHFNVYDSPLPIDSWYEIPPGVCSAIERLSISFGYNVNQIRAVPARRYFEICTTVGNKLHLLLSQFPSLKYVVMVLPIAHRKNHYSDREEDTAGLLYWCLLQLFEGIAKRTELMNGFISSTRRPDRITQLTQVSWGPCSWQDVWNDRLAPTRLGGASALPKFVEAGLCSKASGCESFCGNTGCTACKEGWMSSPKSSVKIWVVGSEESALDIIAAHLPPPGKAGNVS